MTGLLSGKFLLLTSLWVYAMLKMTGLYLRGEYHEA